MCGGDNPDAKMKWYLNQAATASGVTSMTITRSGTSGVSPNGTITAIGGKWETLTWSGSSISTATVKYRVSGDIVEFAITLKPSANAAGFSSLVTLPAGVRPGFERHIGVIPNRAGGAPASQVLADVTITTAGVVSINSNSSSTFVSGTTHYMNFMFML